VNERLSGISILDSGIGFSIPQVAHPRFSAVRYFQWGAVFARAFREVRPFQCIPPATALSRLQNRATARLSVPAFVTLNQTRWFKQYYYDL
jgi:hypothetical protein